MAATTSILVKGDISFLKLYNGILRTGVKPLLSLEDMRGAFIESNYNAIFFPIELTRLPPLKYSPWINVKLVLLIL